MITKFGPAMLDWPELMLRKSQLLGRDAELEGSGGEIFRGPVVDYRIEGSGNFASFFLEVDWCAKHDPLLCVYIGEDTKRYTIAICQIRSTHPYKQEDGSIRINIQHVGVLKICKVGDNLDRSRVIGL